ncbi:hypothetical protein ACODT3_15695 [Streptomyces sp. 4.24]|uniref:hypothetical protein n=1 Tax=Streptomyces tritrimontium TaxID=3406573 RepID=UPI003BB60EF4
MTGTGPQRSDPHAPPEDYRLLVPRDWFRVDLTHERWRPQLKLYVDRHTAGKNPSAELRQAVWASLRNTAEAGLAEGALELYLRSEVDPGSAEGQAGPPASLLVSLLHTPPGGCPDPADLALTLAAREPRTQDGGGREAYVVSLPAGEAVRAATVTALDYHVVMPGGVGYLMLAFALPLSGTEGPLGGLCDAIAHSLRWV